MNVYNPRTIDLFAIDSKKGDDDYKRALVNHFRAKASNAVKEIKEIDDLLYGVIDPNEYKWLLNPFNAKDERFKRYPGDLRNMDIMMPIIRRFIGEYIKSYSSFHVISKLPDEDNTFLDELNEFAIDIMSKKATAHIQKAMSEAGDENVSYNSEDANLNVDMEVDKFKLRWKDQRALIDDNLLEFLKADTNDEYLYLKAYTYWITYGQYYTDRYIQHDDLIKEVIHPAQAFPIFTEDDFVEDYDAFLIRKSYNLTGILANFRGKLTDEHIKYLREGHNQYDKTGDRNLSVEFMRSQYFEDDSTKLNKASRAFVNTLGEFTVDKIYFKGYKEINILKYFDILNEEQEIEVTKDYKLNKEFGDISLTPEHLPTVYVTYGIGERHTGIYLEAEEVPVQRTDMNNIAMCKIPVTGKVGIMPGFPNHSIPKTLEYYQKIINILYLSRERAIAKNHGKVGIFPKGLLGGDDVSEEEQLYYMKSSGMFFPDNSNGDFASAVQALKQIDLSDHQYIESLSRMIIEVKELANEAVDMNRQRAGETYASDGKFTTQQAIIRSSLGSAVINETFNNSRQRDYNADIDFTKIAWLEGKRSKFISTDRKVKFFEVNGTQHSETQYGVYADNSTKTNEKIAKLQEVAFSASQNGDFDIAVEALDTENLSKLKEILLKYQREREENEKSIQRSQKENADTIAQGTRDAEQTKQTHEDTRANKDNQVKLLIAQLNAKIELRKLTVDGNGDGFQSIDAANAEITELKQQLKSQETVI